MRSRVLTFALAFAAASPLAAQGFMGEMHRDVNAVQKKIIDLAKAMPEATYGWKPSADTRSVGEVFLHIAADNYLIPIMWGKPAPAATGITTDYATAGRYEKRTLTKAQIVAELEASFTHLHQGMALTTDANGSETIKFFGQDSPRIRTMVGTVTHLHEHLGQAIAYARSNKVVPPWSQ
ncbi:MAG: DinB family protein [Gemmatimonadaceae bacterium]